MNCWKPKFYGIRQSAAKLPVHRGKVQRLPEGYSPLNNRPERPPTLRVEDIVRAYRNIGITGSSSVSGSKYSIWRVRFDMAADRTRPADHPLGLR